MTNSFRKMMESKQVVRSDNGMKMKLEDVHPEPDFNVRACTSEEDKARLEAHIESIKEYIKGGGVLMPMEVRPREEGGVWIVDGHCRREAYARAKNEGCPVNLVDVRAFAGNDADRIARMATSNEGLKLLPLEVAAVYKRLRNLGLDQTQIAKLVNKTAQHVGQVLTLADANVDVQEQVARGEVSASTAIQMVKKHGEDAGAQIVEFRAKTGGKKVPGSLALKKTKLTEMECKALDMFLAIRHAEWKKCAESFMDEDERRSLEAKLAGFK